MHHGICQLLLVGVAAQALLFFRVADEGGFHQHAGDVGRFEHGKAGLLDALHLRIFGLDVEVAYQVSLVFLVCHPLACRFRIR